MGEPPKRNTYIPITPVLPRLVGNASSPAPLPEGPKKVTAPLASIR